MARATTNDFTQLLAGARETLASKGFMKLSALPKPARSAVCEALTDAGFELTKSVVRVPVTRQLEAAFKDGSFISLKSVQKQVGGATAAEAKAAAQALVDSGRLKVVLRGKEETLVPAATPIFSLTELARVTRGLDNLALTIKKLSKSKAKIRPGLLQSDVLGLLQELTATLSQPPRSALSINALLDAVDAAQDNRTGLSFIPDVVARLRTQADTKGITRALMGAAMDGLLELRPEGGINRLSEEELSMCPPGPQGTRLSWARRIQGDTR